MELRLIKQDDYIDGSFSAECEAQARLTLQQVYEWGQETCPHDLGEGTRCYRHACDMCWEELKQEGK